MMCLMAGRVASPGRITASPDGMTAYPDGMTAFPGGMTALLDHREQIFLSGPHRVSQRQENPVEIWPDPCSVGT